MKYILSYAALFFAFAATAQENMHPSPPQSAPILILGGTVHVGNGSIIENGYVLFDKGKILEVGSGTINTIGTTITIDATGKQVYPGIIAPSTNLGLVEVGSIRATQDYSEVGDFNANIHSLVAYNTDSKVINTLRSNGVLLAHIVPAGGGALRGTSSVVQLDAWNWEDAAYKTSNGVHLSMPLLLNRPNQPVRRGREQVDLVKQGLEKIAAMRNFFYEAKAYHSLAKHVATNLKYEAVKGLFDKTQTLYVHCTLVKEILMAMDLASEFGFKMVLVGAADSWIIADQLKAKNIAVILSEPHSLPSTEDDDVDQPYKTGAALQKAGVLFTICQDGGDGFWRQRDLPFQAGTLSAYGLTREEALSAITLNAAKILGIDSLTGSLEKGKDANIVISAGDILDMKNSKVEKAFIQGREINLDNKQSQLYERYKYKYQLQ